MTADAMYYLGITLFLVIDFSIAALLKTELGQRCLSAVWASICVRYVDPCRVELHAYCVFCGNACSRRIEAARERRRQPDAIELIVQV
jgi:hypothetical protein